MVCTGHAAEGKPESPLGQLGEFATSAGDLKGAKSPPAFNGYVFRILTKQGNTAQGGARDYMVNGLLTGGFAVLAYPAEYRNSGIMTFLVGSDGVVYQKDLGEGTSDVAATITAYDPGDGWTSVHETSTTSGLKTQGATKASEARQ